MARQRHIMAVQLALAEYRILPTRSQVAYRLDKGMKISEVIQYFIHDSSRCAIASPKITN